MAWMLLVLVAGCSTTTSSSTSPAATLALAAAAPAPGGLGHRAKTAGCTRQAGLPDPACTPGATDPRVTQATLATTICSRGYTAIVRPPLNVTEKIKLRGCGYVAGPRSTSPPSSSKPSARCPSRLRF